MILGLETGKVLPEIWPDLPEPDLKISIWPQAIWNLKVKNRSGKSFSRYTWNLTWYTWTVYEFQVSDRFRLDEVQVISDWFSFKSGSVELQPVSIVRWYNYCGSYLYFIYFLNYYFEFEQYPSIYIYVSILDIWMKISSPSFSVLSFCIKNLIYKIRICIIVL